MSGIDFKYDAITNETHGFTLETKTMRVIRTVEPYGDIKIFKFICFKGYLAKAYLVPIDYYREVHAGRSITRLIESVEKYATEEVDI